MIRKFARPYAKAALSHVQSDDDARRLLEDFERLTQALSQVPALASMAGNPAVPMEAKKKAVEEVAGKLEMGALARRLVLVLTENLRLQHAGDVTEALRELVRKRLGIVSAHVTSATELDPEQTSRLREVLERALGKKVELSLEVSPALLGGFIAQIGSRRYDVSLSGQLTRMSEEMAAAEA